MAFSSRRGTTNSFEKAVWKYQFAFLNSPGKFMRISCDKWVVMLQDGVDGAGAGARSKQQVPAGG
jgi:hypothetical protein